MFPIEYAYLVDLGPAAPLPTLDLVLVRRYPPPECRGSILRLVPPPAAGRPLPPFHVLVSILTAVPHVAGIVTFPRPLGHRALVAAKLLGVNRGAAEPLLKDYNRLDLSIRPPPSLPFGPCHHERVEPIHVVLEDKSPPRRPSAMVTARRR